MPRRVCRPPNSVRTVLPIGPRVVRLLATLGCLISGTSALPAGQGMDDCDIEIPITVPAVPLGTPSVETPPEPLSVGPTTDAAPARQSKIAANEQAWAVLHQGLQIEPAAITITDVRVSTFQDIAPGTTSVEELTARLGDSVEVTTRNDHPVHIFQVGPFPRVEFLVKDEKVIEIGIQLSAPTAAMAIAEQLDIERFVPAAVFNQAGAQIGIVYPERGVRFEFADGARDNVERIVLQPIDAAPFVHRAEQDRGFHYRLRLADLRYARRLDPQNSKAMWMEARILSQMGNHERSLALAKQASELTDDPEFDLTYAVSLFEMEQFSKAREQADLIAADDSLPPLLRARAKILLGDLFAKGPVREFERAIEHHLMAIRLASKLEANPEISLRRQALKILVQAHLACATDVAQGNWQRKIEVVPKWLATARELAARYVHETQGTQLIDLQIHSATLSAAAELVGNLDPANSLQQMSDRSQLVIDQAKDPFYKQQIQWQLASALLNAARATRARGNFQQAREWGERAAVLFELGGKHRDPTPEHRYLQAKARFLVGTLYAIPENNHQQAIDWYHRALRDFPETLPASAAHEVGLQGERFVSMGISFWATGHSDHAVQLTERGTEWMERAVQAGLLVPQALAVAYGNLAAMYRELGEPDMAATFTSKAEQIR